MSTLLIFSEAAKIIANDEGFKLNKDLKEYLLTTGAKMYPPKNSQTMWCIVGYTSNDTEDYQAFAI
jgi:hypothetical protein